MVFTLRTAAQHTGTSKSTILRAIKSGRLSATRLEDGSYEIDPAELERVYPAQRMKQRAMDAMEHHAPTTSDERNTVAPDATTAALTAQIEGLREILKRADATADELREDRDRWRNMAEQAQRLIPDQRQRRSWWQRLTGT